MTGNWDHYVFFRDPTTGIEGSIRCAGLATAEAIATQKVQCGFERVRIMHRRSARKKERLSYVSYGRIPIPEWGRRGH